MAHHTMITPKDRFEISRFSTRRTSTRRGIVGIKNTCLIADSSSGKCRRLPIVANLSQSSKPSLHETCDGRNFSCDCCPCVIPEDTARRLNKESYEVLTVTFCTTKKGADSGARHGKSEDQRAYHQAKDCLRKAKREGYSSVLHRFRKSEI